MMMAKDFSSPQRIFLRPAYLPIKIFLSRKSKRFKRIKRIMNQNSTTQQPKATTISLPVTAIFGNLSS
jgi:hypothetical protein